MTERVRNVLALLREQLWIVPAFMSLLAIALALLLVGQEPTGGDTGGTNWWLFGGDAETARNLLSALLSGLMTMTSLVVSITFVILTLASNQLGPRIVSNFIADRQIQVVVGVFLGTTMYLVVVLRSFDGSLGADRVPGFAVSVGSALTAVCLFALLFYIHKVARSIVADRVVERIVRELYQSIDELPDAGAAAPEPHDDPSGLLPPQSAVLSFGRSGYIQTIDYDALVSAAEKDDVVLHVLARAGQFVLGRGEHVTVHGSPRPGHIEQALDAAVVIGTERSPAQDIEFSIRRMVEIALRALSAGINDPFTAITVVDHLGDGLARLFERSPPPKVLCDRTGHTRVIASRSDFEGVIVACFTQIRQSAASHPDVLIRMADLIGQLAGMAAPDEARGALLRQLTLIEQSARQTRLIAGDREAVLARVAAARRRAAGLHAT